MFVFAKWAVVIASETCRTWEWIVGRIEIHNVVSLCFGLDPSKISLAKVRLLQSSAAVVDELGVADHRVLKSTVRHVEFTSAVEPIETVEAKTVQIDKPCSLFDLALWPGFSYPVVGS
jgi:hypothetical protein